MTIPLSPQEIQELAAGYVLGDLDSSEAEWFQQLLSENPALHQEVMDLQEALALMPYELADVEVDDRVRSQLLAKAEAELSLTSPTVAPLPSPELPPPLDLSPHAVSEPPHAVEPLQQPPRRFRLQRPWLVSAAAAALAIVCGLGTVHLSRQVRLLQAEAEQRQHASSVVHTWTGLDDLLQDHQKSLANPSGPVDFVVNQPGEVLDWLQGFRTTVAALPLLPAYQDKLLGGSNCQFGKVPGLRLTYQLSSDRTISAYQLALTDQTIPELQSAQITLQQPDGTGLVLWSDDHYLYALVATLPIAELQTLAQTIDGT